MNKIVKLLVFAFTFSCAVHATSDWTPREDFYDDKSPQGIIYYHLIETTYGGRWDITEFFDLLINLKKDSQSKVVVEEAITEFVNWNDSEYSGDALLIKSAQYLKSYADYDRDSIKAIANIISITASSSNPQVQRFHNVFKKIFKLK